MFGNFRKETVHAGTPEFLVVGLGNPDRKYALTRHNSGFLCVDALAEKHGFSVSKIKFKSLMADTVISGRRCIVLKPQTYMNNSGEAVREAAAFYKIPPERILVFADEISLDVGRLRIRRKGSDGGQKGVRSIIYHLASDNFPRVKVGVGKKPHPDYDLGDWVLSEFKKDEMPALKEAVDKAVSAAELILDGKMEDAMARYNG